VLVEKRVAPASRRDAVRIAQDFSPGLFEKFASRPVGTVDACADWAARANSASEMAKSLLDTPVLFPDDLIPESNELLQLDKSALVKALHLLKSADSVGALRGRLDVLREELAEPSSPLRSDTPGDDDVEFASSRLSEELDQIGASATLERAFYYIDRLIRSVTEVRLGDVNDINLNRWKEYSDIYLDSLWKESDDIQVGSLWNIERRDNSGVHNAGYWGHFIP